MLVASIASGSFVSAMLQLMHLGYQFLAFHWWWLDEQMMF